MSEAFQVGDLVRFEGEYTTGVRPFEPRDPRASVTTELGEQTFVPVRFGLGLYYIEANLGIAGEAIVRFSGELGGRREVYSEQSFSVVAAGQVVHRSLPPQLAPEDTSRADARWMMIEDLRAAGMHLTDAHSDTVVASAHAAMMKRRAEVRHERPAIPMRAPVPLRPLKR